MKTQLIQCSNLIAAFPLVALVVLPPAIRADALRLGWFTTDGGDGISRGGEFSLAGTVGQPEAGVARGGEFKVESGYWRGVHIDQSPGALQLRIRLRPDGNVVLAWPVGVAGFVLEQCSMPGTTWTPTLRPVLDTAAEHTVTVPATGPMRCYRLRRAQP